MDAGVRDSGGLGGGKGCNNGAPYGRCRLAAGGSGGAVGMDEETGGIIAEDEGGGTKKEEGFKRLVVRLLLESVVSRGIKGVDDDKGDGICKVGTVGEATLTGREAGGTDAEDW